jgi:hypothetical protein
MFFFKMRKAARGPTKPSVESVMGDVSPGVKQPWCRGDFSPPSSGGVKNEWSYTSVVLFNSSCTGTISLHLTHEAHVRSESIFCLRVGFKLYILSKGNTMTLSYVLK